uniref:Uncharacterized protein n=1 Tax=Oryza glumipatula TaxID=40148 RepID=A0A0D9YS99_9ORYZ
MAQAQHPSQQDGKTLDRDDGRRHGTRGRKAGSTTPPSRWRGSSARIDPGTAYLLKIRLHGHHSRENFTYKIEEVVDSGRTNFKDFIDDIREKYP